MTTTHLVGIIGEELKSGFFKELSTKFEISVTDITDVWNTYFDANVKAPRTRNAVKKPIAKSVVVNGTIATATAPGTSGGGGGRKKTPALAREHQEQIALIDITTTLTVETLKKYNRQRGLTVSGNKAILLEALRKYETDFGNSGGEASGSGGEASGSDEEPEPAISASRPVRKVKGTPIRSVPTVKPEDLTATTDQYNHLVVLDDLVWDETLGKVVGFVGPEGDVLDLDSVHIAKCRENQLELIHPENFD